MRFFDFHTHPYISEPENIKRYKVPEDAGYARQRAQMESVGIYRAAGSVIHVLAGAPYTKETLLLENEIAMQIFAEHGDFYVPGIRIHPDFVQESCAAVEAAYKKGVRLIGELTPYSSGVKSYTDCAEIFDLAQSLDMVVSCHPTTNEDMNRVCEMFPRLTFVFAHPGEHAAYTGHIDRMQKYENAYLDISGTGLFRYGMLRYGIDKVGADRILFGTDYPVCNAGMYVGGVLFEELTAEELEKVAYKNAERLLGL